MAEFQFFLSVVVVVRNRAENLSAMVSALGGVLAGLAGDYEIIVVDNASEDESVAILKRLADQERIPNLQVYVLTKEVDPDIATSVGLENALGDFIAIIDPLVDDAAFLRAMLERAANGADVVFAANTERPARNLAHRLGHASFNRLFKWFNGIDLDSEAPQFRILSRSVANFILQHAQPALAYRHLPATAGFARANLVYRNVQAPAGRHRLRDSFDRGMRLLVSSTHGPMRLVTALSLVGAVSNVVYSLYVIAIALLKENVAPGWTTLSLQQSGMFFLISLVLWILGEYMLQMASLSNEGPRYHVAQEFSSAVITRRQRLNVEVETGVGLPHAGRGPAVSPTAGLHSE